MAKTKTSEIVKLTDWRLSFAQLDKPKAFKPGQDPRFEATFLGDPTREDHAAQIGLLKAQAVELIKAQWGEKPAGLLTCFGLANNNEKKAKYDGYADQFYLVTANKDRPTITSRSAEVVVPGSSQWPYSGCYVNTNVTLWCQDNAFGKAIRANLRIIQFVKDGKAFGAGQASADEFAPLGDTRTAGVSAVSADSFEL